MKNVILELTRLQQEILRIDSPLEQIRKIVDSISEVIETDVCSLYLADDDNDMILIASHGLAESRVVKIPAGKGLVGLVAKNRHPVNVAKADEHPNFYYVESTQEERFQSFCGVPLVRYGKIMGVLVVQGVAAVVLPPESEAFLVTLSSQLALIVDDIPSTESINSNIRITGVKGSSGVGIGEVMLCDKGDLYNIADSPCEDIDQTIAEWHQLLQEVKHEIVEEQLSLSENLSESVSSIFQSYSTLLSDPAFIARIEDEIKSGNWLPGALRKGIVYFSELFLAINDPYLKARHEDIHHLGNKLYDSFRGMKPAEQLNVGTDSKIVLVGAQVSISDIAQVALEKIQGIVCFEGSSMSHTAVLANALGIPAVMSIGSLKHLNNQEEIIVDGNSGQIIRFPSDLLIMEYQHLIEEETLLNKQLATLKNMPSVTLDEIEIKLFTNSGLLADLSPGLESGAQGIGLYRTEIPFIIRDSFPSEDEQIEVYQHVFKAYADKPVYMRTLDVGGDKQLPYFPISNEDNPALGWRGIRFSLDNIQLLMTQVRAMIRAAGQRDDFNILLPMVSSTRELDTFHELLNQAMIQLKAEGYKIKKPGVGVMIEVPAAISQIQFWAEKIDFISIGSNDLSQYLLAVDRNNGRVAGLYDGIHPAVIHEIYRIVKEARSHKLPLSLCGEIASDPLAAILLLGMGIRTLSMSANKLPRIKWLIRSITIEQAEAVLHQSLKLDSVESIRTLLQEVLDGLQLDEKAR